MSGVVQVLAHCGGGGRYPDSDKPIGCGRPFAFHPHLVPSVRDQQNVRQPLCEDCVTRANAIRKTLGLPAFRIPAGAYEPCREEEL